MHETVKGRFAPTPSGFLHLGNVFCSLLAWLWAKKAGGSVLLRIEDLDARRCPRENADALARDLEWLGLDWDEGAYRSVDSENYFQSNRSAVYEKFFRRLQQQGLLYPCFCSRNEVHAAMAPHFSDGRVIYPGTCRRLSEEERAAKAKLRPPAYRLKTADETISFHDELYGECSFALAKENGDCIVRRSDGVFAYQLAVTVDDGLMGVTQVVRGADLLSSTPLQLYLFRLLDREDGALQALYRELAALKKRLGSAEALIGQLAWLAGQLPRPEPITPAELLPLFDPKKIPRHNIVVPPELLCR